MVAVTTSTSSCGMLGDKDIDYGYQTSHDLLVDHLLGVKMEYIPVKIDIREPKRCHYR